MKHTILSVIRHGLTFGGGYLAAKGYVSSDTATAIVPAIVTAVGVVWGAVDEYLAAKAEAKTKVAG